MMEETNGFRKKDRTTVDANNKFEVEYLHQQYPWYSYQQIKDVIKTAGPLYTHVERELSQKRVAPRAN